MNKNDKNRKDHKKVEIEESNGLNISYNRTDFNKQFPHLIEEISKKKKSLKIDSININTDQTNMENTQESNNSYPNELYNPGVIDFLRRCTENEDAINILDYLMRRNEITQQEYHNYRKIISQEGGLKQLIDQFGGLKRPGYYMKKYYKNNINNQKINSKQD
ncbi:MAG: DUF2095 family protein [Candidatus Heimdallarchaeota archaeon]